MNVRELAFEVSQLSARDRAALLAELPRERRAVVERTMQEMDAQLGRTKPNFDAQFELATNAVAVQLRRLNAGQLRLLLSAEHPSVQSGLSDAIRHTRLQELPPAVRPIVEDFLEQRLRAIDMEAGHAVRPRTKWWKPWLK